MTSLSVAEGFSSRRITTSLSPPSATTHTSLRPSNLYYHAIELMNGNRATGKGEAVLSGGNSHLGRHQ